MGPPLKTYYTTTVEEISPQDQGYFDEQRHRNNRYGPLDRPALANAKDKLAQQMAAAKALAAHNAQALVAMEHTCLDHMNQLEAVVRHLSAENERLRSELVEAGRTAGTGESPPQREASGTGTTPHELAEVARLVHITDYSSDEGFTNRFPSPSEDSRQETRSSRSSASHRKSATGHLPSFIMSPSNLAASTPNPGRRSVQAPSKPPPERVQAAVPASRAPSMCIQNDSQDDGEGSPHGGRRNSLASNTSHSTSDIRRMVKDAAAKGKEPGEPNSKDKGAHKVVFADAESMKAKVKEALMKPVYNVNNFYYETGIWQYIARSNLFDNMTLCIVAVNAIWISVDSDLNPAKGNLLKAAPIFQIAEHFFCTYFSTEVVIRFMAFKRKRDCLRDHWFVFDSALVTIMILETWVMTVVLVVGGDGAGSLMLGNPQMIRLVRLLRLSRMARMVRLLRAMPELMVLIKGVVIAMRSVFFTLCLLVIIIYLFAIFFKEMSEGTPLRVEFFSTIPDAMLTLLLHATLPDVADVVYSFAEQDKVLAGLLMLFILLSSLTVMNMLVGVLCEVVSVVSTVEKEQMTVQFVKTKLVEMLADTGIDADGNMHISKDEFESLLLNPQAARMVQEVGVDVVGLVDFADFIFKDGAELSFAEFMELVLQLRGSNVCTVKDIVDLRKFVINQMAEFEENFISCVEDLLPRARPIEAATPQKPVASYVTSLSNFSPRPGKGDDDFIDLKNKPPTPTAWIQSRKSDQEANCQDMPQMPPRYRGHRRAQKGSGASRLQDIEDDSEEV